MSNIQLDLRGLTLDRSPAASATNGLRRRRRWLSKYALSVGIVLGFVVLLAATAGRQLLPKRDVTVVPVIVKRSAAPTGGNRLFQAAGWIEPRPTSVRIAALPPGVIDELLVVAGQPVEKGEPIARLIAIDSELAMQQAQVTLAIREAELQRAEAEQVAADIRLTNPVHRRADLADAMSLLARIETELDKPPFLVQAARADVEFRQASLDGKVTAGSAVAGVTIQQAKRDHAIATADLLELQSREPNLRKEADALRTKVDALQEQLKLLVDERRQAAEANARVITAESVRDEARLGLKKAELSLERMVVVAPMTGRILSVIASPGTRVMGLEEVAGQNSSTVAEMYDPDSMQVRADVGTISVDGTELTQLTRGQLADWRAANLGCIFQTHNLIPVLTAYENAELPTLLLKLSSAERRQRVELALEAVGLTDRADHYPRQLSGGQEQRVGIARAIVAHPKVVVADEPTGSLDAETSEQIQDLLKRLNQELNITMLMVTHDLNVASIASRRLTLNRGKFLDAQMTAV